MRRPTAATSDTPSRRDLLLFALPALIVVLAAFVLAWQFVRPAPPTKIVMSTGAAGGAYHYFGERYREKLAQDGIEVELRPSSGAVQNLMRLKTDDSVDIGFIQGGIANEPESEDLATLGSMYLEPVWVFYRGSAEYDRVAQLKGKKIAVGLPGSGAQLFALQILGANGFATNDPHLVPIGGMDAVEALKRGQVDAFFVVGAPQAPVVQALLQTSGISLLNFAQADGYGRHFPHLMRLTLPRGAIDIQGDRPPRDLQLVAATANLVVKADIHPAIVTLLLKHARDIHSPPGLLQAANAFPKPLDHALPVHPSAQRFYDSGPPLLQRYLPFWLAVLVDRLFVMLLPLIAVVIPLSKVVPAVYNWRMRSRVYRWYGELKYLENELDQDPQAAADAKAIATFIARVDRIEQRATHRKLPLAFSNELYTLREHIALVRRRLLRLAESTTESDKPR
ncbi:TAXI family TRAP transporter solute-binding subunit [Zoogloea oleivorans]|uniref:TAXI family TRAP transporter solute-binding subunit n=1 Tax=Zoogloea oleivorans TaxID=1552750 RepID=A0A6C2CXS3_9RHOO|nr:TAXI family TRAP transporter solute-binding subunit [Zoogloea oleivorans]MBP8133758.1 TAXI family TRAP transporter solute-binding subunit [Zoogloea sp.]TYC58917.1 TAXI family TRAP transporter solute-binding subunit [Zoogloea oleivorans]